MLLEDYRNSLSTHIAPGYYLGIFGPQKEAPKTQKDP